MQHFDCGQLNLIGYSDADWANDVDDRHSITGTLFMMSNGAVSWNSKKQAVVSLSTAEAEYVALSSTTQEAIWLKRLLCDLGTVSDIPVLLMEDNRAAIAIARNPVGHARTKHIDVRYHFAREAVANGQIKLQYCQTRDMIADILTKAISKVQFEKLRLLLGLCEM